MHFDNIIVDNNEEKPDFEGLLERLSALKLPEASQAPSAQGLVVFQHHRSHPQLTAQQKFTELQTLINTSNARGLVVDSSIVTKQLTSIIDNMNKMDPLTEIWQMAQNTLIEIRAGLRALAKEREDQNKTILNSLVYEG